MLKGEVDEVTSELDKVEGVERDSSRGTVRLSTPVPPNFKVGESVSKLQLRLSEV